MSPDVVPTKSVWPSFDQLSEVHQGMPLFNGRSGWRSSITFLFSKSQI